MVHGRAGMAALGTASFYGTAPLLATVAISILLGVVYSVDVPGLRWKKHPVRAAACILAVRAILVQVRSADTSSHTKHCTLLLLHC